MARIWVWRFLRKIEEGFSGAGEIDCRGVRCVILVKALIARVARDGLSAMGAREEEMDLEIWRTCSPEMARGSAIGAMRDA